MARLITPGNLNPPPARWLVPLTCPACGAVFQLDAAEIAPRVGEVVTGLWTRAANVLEGTCPYCQQRVAITGAQ